MADLFYVSVLSGQAVTGAFAFERSDRPLIVHIPSLSAATEVRPQFSATSGGPFSTLMRDDGSGAPYAVHSGGGPGYGVIRSVPSPWGRFTFTGSQSDVRTLTLYPGPAR